MYGGKLARHAGARQNFSFFLALSLFVSLQFIEDMPLSPFPPPSSLPTSHYSLVEGKDLRPVRPRTVLRLGKQYVGV